MEGRARRARRRGRWCRRPLWNRNPAATTAPRRDSHPIVGREIARLPALVLVYELLLLARLVLQIAQIARGRPDTRARLHIPDLLRDVINVVRVEYGDPGQPRLLLFADPLRGSARDV